MIRPRELSLSLSLFPARTPTLPPATHTNSYALGARDVLLVEPATPYEGEQRAWLEWARGLASQGRRVVGIVATHHHPDHVGGVEVLSRELGAKVLAHPRTIADLPRNLGDSSIVSMLEDGQILTLEGPTPEAWTVLHTPGHAWGHICLWNTRTRTVVVGDMVASVGTILIAPGDGDMAIYLQQIERLAGLDARLALPAHGSPIDEPTALFRQYIAHRLMREAKVQGALTPTPQTPADLVPSAYDDTPVHLWPLAKMSLEMHLKKLGDEGKATERDGRWSLPLRSI